MFTKIWIILSCFLIISTIAFAELEKTKQAISVCVDRYNISDTETILLYGAKNRKWLGDNWYWGEAGYGAIGGKRSGYIEGGIIAGYTQPLTPQLFWDARLFFGAGGGGSAPQGGGMIVQPTLGLGYQLTRAYSLYVEAGYMHFINGDISSLSIGAGMSINYWGIMAKE